MNAYTAVDQYARLSLRTDIESASPHRLILMLLEGGIEKIRAARLALQRGGIADKGANISWAISIIDGLRASLNLEQGGQLAANLDNLYDYMARTLVEANLHNDPARLDVVENLMQEIRAGWKGIENQVGQAPHAHDNAIGPNAVAIS
ncbi:MAG: flagellar export chaperone FliS [Gammaproteobacteria bacterium]|jgi:flagellar protein FliS